MMQLGVSDVLFKHMTGFFHYVYSVVTTSQKSAGVSETINHGDFFFGMIIGTTTSVTLNTHIFALAYFI